MVTKIFRFILTLLLLGAALWAGKAGWDHYEESPWTRDGHVRAEVINIAADISGTVTGVSVKDNQFVHKGDILFTIDKDRYVTALAQAKANLAAQQVEKNRRGSEARRRASLGADIVSAESKDNADFAVSAASAQLAALEAAVKTAEINLERTTVRAPVNGYVTNLLVHTGDFAAVGASRMALIDSDSYYVIGYFEETKLPQLAAGAKVDMKMLDGADLQGHVESIARGITDRDATTGRELLADVNPTFNWVRLAQRIPVRVHIDAMPKDFVLVAGSTCTVVINTAKKTHA
jgi:RND family efflux transporter MFP subunit